MVGRLILPFQQCSHLSNPWSDNKKVSLSKDGQVQRLCADLFTTLL